jgi:hypothetical protein
VLGRIGYVQSITASPTNVLLWRGAFPLPPVSAYRLGRRIKSFKSTMTVQSRSNPYFEPQWGFGPPRGLQPSRRLMASSEGRRPPYEQSGVVDNSAKFFLLARAGVETRSVNVHYLFP